MRSRQERRASEWLARIRVRAILPRVRLRTEIDINASPEQIWRVLTDFSAYGEWNPFLRSVTGEPVVGGKLKVMIVGPGGAQVPIRPQVLTFDAPRELSWRGELPIPGLVRGEHFFRLQDLGDGRTRLLHGEDFSGVLVRFLGGVLAKVQDQFAEMNTALKRRVEASSS